MSNKFNWKGFKVALIGLVLVAIPLFIKSDSKIINYMANIIMVIGICIVFLGGIMHHKELFKLKD